VSPAAGDIEDVAQFVHQRRGGGVLRQYDEVRAGLTQGSDAGAVALARRTLTGAPFFAAF
jgi:hypothetical protein